MALRTPHSAAAVVSAVRITPTIYIFLVEGCRLMFVNVAYNGQLMNLRPYGT